MCKNHINNFCASDICTLLGFEMLGADTCLVADWKSDNRTVSEGNGFIAIRGATFDGHDFISDAIAKGASIIVAEKRNRELISDISRQNPTVCFILVEEPIHDFAKIAKTYLNSVKPLLVAITGSVGKTTTKELCLSVAKSQYRTYGTRGNRNTLLGNSMTIMSMGNDTEVLVLEFGTNHFGEIAELADYFNPDVAILTEIADAHLEEFKSCTGVLKEKVNILKHKDELKAIIYNKENEHLASYFENQNYSCPIYAVGRDGNCRLEKEIHLSISPQKTSCNCGIDGENVVLESSLFGVQHARNMAIALSLGKFLNIDLEKIKKALAETNVLVGRGQIHSLKRNCFLMDEAYNSNPMSCHAAIQNLLYASSGVGRKFTTFAVLGGMRELGNETDTLHQRLIDEIELIDCVYLLGQEWQNCDTSRLKSVKLFNSLESIKHEVMDFLNGATDTILLVKGSNSYGLCNVVNEVKEQMQ